MAEMQAQVKEEKEWWERRKAGIQEGFMKELEEDGKEKTEQVRKASVGGKTGSDEDAVLVEAGGPAATPGSSKKKKGKK